MKIHELWTLLPIFHQSIQFAGNLSQNQNSEEQRHYDCESWGRSSTQLENLDKHIMGIHARQRNHKCVSCFISRLSFKDKEIINVKILYSNDKSEDTFKMFHEEQKNF